MSAAVLSPPMGAVTVRAATPADRAGIAALYHRVSARSMYRRYFRIAVDVEQAVDDLLDRAHAGEVAIALLGGDAVGVASYVRLAEPHAAEISLLVQDDHQHSGVGSRLLEHIAAHAAAHGVTRLLAEVLTENLPMLHLAAHSGLQETALADGSVMELTLSAAGCFD